MELEKRWSNIAENLDKISASPLFLSHFFQQLKNFMDYTWYNFQEYLCYTDDI